MRLERIIAWIPVILASLVALPLVGRAAPTLIHACTTISSSGSYVLGSNLYASGDCIVVDAPFVSIDMAGFAILGNGDGAGIRADSGAERGGLEVRGGTIADFHTGIGSDARVVYGGVIVEQMRLVSNFYGAALGPRSTARENNVRSARNGLDMGNYATAHANDVSDFIGVGIHVGVGSRVTDNRVARLTGGRPDTPLRPPTLDPGGAGGSRKPNTRASIPPRLDDSALDLFPEPSGITLPDYDPPDVGAEDGQAPQGGQSVPAFPPHEVSKSKGIGIEAHAGSTIARNTVFDGVTGIRAESGSTVVHNTTGVHFTGIMVDCPAAIIGNTSTENFSYDVLTGLPAANCKKSQNATD